MKNIAIVFGTYHRDYVEQMLTVVRNDAPILQARIVREVGVPGSLEKPLAVKRLLLDDSIDAVVTLGIIEKGETQHGLVMGQAVIRALIDLQLQFLKPIGVGILGPGIQPSQIPARLIPHARNALHAACIMLESPP